MGKQSARVLHAMPEFKRFAAGKTLRSRYEVERVTRIELA